MKHTFLRLLMAAEAATSSPATPVLTSDKLVELKAKYKAAWENMLKFTDPESQEARDAKFELYKIDGEIEAEKQAIVRAQKEAEIEQARQGRLALNNEQLDAYKALVLEQAKKSPDTAKVAELETAFKVARDKVDNELLAKFAGAKTVGKKADGDTSSKGTSAVRLEIVELYRQGKKHKDIEAIDPEKYKRSTVWHAINDAIDAGEVVKHH